MSLPTPPESHLATTFDLARFLIASVAADDAVILQPLGTGADDWPTVISKANEYAYRATVYLAPGSWLCKSQGVLLSGAQVRGFGMDRTIVTSSITPNGDPLNACFMAETIIGTNSTLSATPGYGTNQFQSNLNVAVGSWVYADSVIGHIGMQYRVLAKSGSGPFTYTVDRAILFPFASGDAFGPITTQARDIVVGDMTFQGSADRCIEFSGLYRSLVENVNIRKGASFFSQCACSFDIGSLECCFYNVHISADLTSTAGTPAGLLVETSERTTVIDCYVDSVANSGIIIYDSVDCHVRGGGASNCNDGVLFTQDATTIGCFDCTVSDCGVNGNRNSGVQFQQGGRCKASNVQADGNLIGFDIGGGATSCIGTQLINCSATGNTGEGYITRPAATKTQMQNVSSRSSGNGGAAGGFIFQGEVDVDGLTSTSNDGNFASVEIYNTVAGSVFRISNFRIERTTSGDGFYLNQSSTSRVHLRDGSINVGSNATCIEHLNSSGMVHLQNVIGVAAGTSKGYLGGTGDTLRQTGWNDFSGCATPYTINGSGFSSRGTLALNGTTPVNYAFTDIKSNDPVKFTMRTRAGTVGPAPTLITTPGTGFSATGSASDTSTYDVDIGE
jgi:hypothetical protein